jgi:hypothetical protein
MFGIGMMELLIVALIAAMMAIPVLALIGLLIYLYCRKPPEQ